MDALAGLRTQWRVGMGGATGLDYTAVLADLREQIPDDATERRQTYLDIKAMEAVTLQEWAEQRPQRLRTDCAGVAHG